MTYGQRAAQLIQERAEENNITIKDELERLELCENIRLKWKKKLSNPRLATMAILFQNGYDIGYILTGERKDNG